MAIAALLGGCSTDLPLAPSRFTVSGVASFDVVPGAVVQVKMALFYTGTSYYPVTQNRYASGITAVLVSNVANLGASPRTAQPFMLAIDLSAYQSDGQIATLVMWDDVNQNDRLDPGEQTQRVIPNVNTGCPVFGDTGYGVPIQYEYLAEPGPLATYALGWNHTYTDVGFRPAATASGANVENDGYFSRR